ncbi:iron-containing alcohol dehydrogenase [Sedimentibacter sp.]|uniref:iron-containing alcohol dehydrogenase n=1 Tax=Sedimentibacter sp. TaxID=1960295 RepID=UPI002897EC76|nr:iron-containing alcohol dehydrogenase [Sedimentibacter sp.]
MNSNIRNPFSFEMPTKIEYGQGSIAKLPEILKELGVKKPLFITGSGSTRKVLLPKATDYLDAAGIEYEVFDKIEANPKDYNVEEAAAFAREKGTDGIIALGGGSPIDAAKAASAIITYGGSLDDYYGRWRVKGPVQPFIVIPTTAGSGSEVTFSSVITDTRETFKKTVKSQYFGPKVALLDPDMTISLPAGTTAATGIDALTHAIEAYSCTVSEPISDACALYAIELIAENIREAVFNPSNIDARSGMLMGSTLAGIAFSHSDVASVHCMAEAMGSLYDAAHGVCNAILLPYVMEYSMDYAVERYARIGRVMGSTAADDKQAAKDAVEIVKQMVKDIKLPTLKDIGIKAEDIEKLAEMSEENGSTPSNPRPMTKKEYVELFNIAIND